MVTLLRVPIVGSEEVLPAWPCCHIAQLRCLSDPGCALIAHLVFVFTLDGSAVPRIDCKAPAPAAPPAAAAPPPPPAPPATGRPRQVKFELDIQPQDTAQPLEAAATLAETAATVVDTLVASWLHIWL